MLDKGKISAYNAILKEELLVATGCTEPIAIAFCAATLRDIMGRAPEKLDIEVSGNIIKNVKSVVVPNTGGMKGIKAAVAAGVVAGDAEALLQVISSITAEKYADIREYAAAAAMNIICMDTPRMLDIRITGFAGNNRAVVRIANNHTKSDMKAEQPIRYY